MSAMKNSLVDLALVARQADADRLARKISRAEHSAILADIRTEMTAMGGTWDDLIELSR